MIVGIRDNIHKMPNPKEGSMHDQDFHESCYYYYSVTVLCWFWGQNDEKRYIRERKAGLQEWNQRGSKVFVSSLTEEDTETDSGKVSIWR